jgi:membrane protease YdiL (CAAX protease family)
MEVTETSGQATGTVTGLRVLMRRYPLSSFFVMAYAFSWIVLIPFILSEWAVLPKSKLFAFFFALNPFAGPTLSAFIMVRVTEGKEGVLRMRRRLVQWRAGLQWYAFILLGIPALFLCAILLVPGAAASFRGLTPAFLVSYAIGFVVIFFFGGPLGEEIGWRGFALPRMQTRFGPLGGSLLLGLLWTCWHLPHFLTSAQRGGPGTGLATFVSNFSIFTLMVLSLSIIFSWVFNRSGGSLFIVILLHASINTFSYAVPLFPVPVVSDSDLPLALGLAFLAALIAIFTRGRLGYQAKPVPIGTLPA